MAQWSGYVALGTSAGGVFTELAAAGYARQAWTFTAPDGGIVRGAVNAEFGLIGATAYTAAAFFDTAYDPLPLLVYPIVGAHAAGTHTVLRGVQIEIDVSNGKAVGAATGSLDPVGVLIVSGSPLGRQVASRQFGAPLRHRMTKTLGCGVIAKTAYPGTTTTLLQIIPIEAPCYAVRLGFGNCYNLAMTISKASVYPSDSYSVLSATGNAGLLDSASSTNWHVVPTGGASGCPAYFDNAGADVATINLAGSARGFTLPAVTGNTGNVQQSFTVQWSDWIPCTSIPRADGGTQHLLFVYVTITSTGMATTGYGAPWTTNADAVAARGRYHWNGQAWSTGTDYADNPTGTGFKSIGNVPVFALQYLTANPGVVVALSGDSLAAAPPADGFTSALRRATWDLSSPGMPVELANLAWGGQAWQVYDAFFRANIAAVQPSIIAPQIISRNSMAGAAQMQQLLALSLADAQTCAASYGASLIFNIPGGEPAWDGTPNYTNGFVDMRNRLLAIAAASGVPVIDAPAVIGNIAGGAPWDYLAGFSDDNTHPNFAGSEAVVPNAYSALRRRIGL